MSSILGITFSPKTKAEIEDLPNKKSLGVLHVVTANPEMLMASMKDQQLQSILQESEYVVADGIGLQWLCRLTGQAIPTRIPGVDLMVAWLEHANEYRKSVVFVGGTEQVALKLRKVLAKVYPRVRVEHVYDITVDGEGKSVQTASVLNSISAVLPDFIFVALGHGKQEKWLDSNKDYFPNKSIVMGVGGALDFVSGHVKRAPCWMRKIGLEWVYRVIQQPWRIGRIITAVPLFTIAALWYQFKHYDRTN